MEEVGLFIEGDVRFVTDFRDAYGAEREIGFNLILSRFECEFIKIGIFGRPVLWDLELDRDRIAAKTVCVAALLER